MPLSIDWFFIIFVCQSLILMPQYQPVSNATSLSLEEN